MQATWTPHEKHGRLTAKGDLPRHRVRLSQLTQGAADPARHVRNSVAWFDQVMDVSDQDCKLAFANIEKAAHHYEVDLSETSWRNLGVHPQPHRKDAAAKAVKTRREKRRG